MGGMIQQGFDIGHKQRIQYVGDFFSVCKTEGPVKRDPHAFEMHGPYFYHVSYFFGFQDSVALAPRHPCNVEQLGTIDHVVVFSSSHAHASRFYLETQRALVFPQRSGDFWPVGHFGSFIWRRRGRNRLLRLLALVKLAFGRRSRRG